MKRYIVFILFSALLLLFSPKIAYAADAEDNFYRAGKATVFYKQSSASAMDALFVLPEGYFVKVLEEREGENFFLVEYAESGNGYTKLIGYVEKTAVTKCAAVPPLFFSSRVTTLSQANLYSRPSVTSDVTLTVFRGQAAAVYGKSENDAFLYVRIGNDFGFVLAQCFEEVAISPHPHLPSPTPKPTSEIGETTETPLYETGFPRAYIPVVIAIAVPTLFIVFFLFKADKRQVR